MSLNDLLATTEDEKEVTQIGDNLVGIAEEIAVIKMTIDDLTAKKKELEAQLRPVLLDQGPKQAGRFVLEVKSVPGATRFDRKAAEEAGMDLSPFMKTGKPYSRLTIKETAE